MCVCVCVCVAKKIYQTLDPHPYQRFKSVLH